MELTREDCEILIEALDAWTKRDLVGTMIGDIMLGVLTKGDPEGHQIYLEEKEKRDRQKKQQQKNDEEIAIMLKSKLLLMRNKI